MGYALINMTCSLPLKFTFLGKAGKYVKHTPCDKCAKSDASQQKTENSENGAITVE